MKPTLKSLMLGAAIVGLIHFQMQAKIDYQLSRNRFMMKEIEKVDTEITEISEGRVEHGSVIPQRYLYHHQRAETPRQ